MGIVASLLSLVCIMNAALLQRLDPEEFLSRTLAEGARADGRGLQEHRKAEIHRGPISSAHGAAAVSFGNSSTMAGVRAEVTEGTPQFPSGRIIVSVDFPPLCSSVFRDSRSKALGLSAFLSNSLTDILNSPAIFDPAQLTIEEGRLFWTLRVNIACLSHDGNAFDLSLLTAVAALEDTQLPSLVLESAAIGDLPRRLMEAPVAASPLMFEEHRILLRSRPLPVTFAQLPGEHWVVDPCASEEGLGASVSLCFVGGKWLVFHHGGSAHKERFLGQLMPVARSCVEGLQKMLDRDKTS